MNSTQRARKYTPELKSSFKPGNSQIDRYGVVVWKSIRLALRSKDLPVSCWETL